jgi:hypothetical protein
MIRFFYVTAILIVGMCSAYTQSELNLVYKELRLAHGAMLDSLSSEKGQLISFKLRKKSQIFECGCEDNAEELKLLKKQEVSLDDIKHELLYSYIRKVKFRKSYIKLYFLYDGKVVKSVYSDGYGEINF